MRRPAICIPGYFLFAAGTILDLLHLAISGRHKVVLSGESHIINPGDMVTYCEAEEASFEAFDEQVAFYSTMFVAPQLKPLPPEKRCFRARRAVSGAFRKYFEASFEPDKELRDFQLWSGLYDLLQAIRKQHGPSFESDKEMGVRYLIEKAIREHRMFRPTLDELCKICPRSKSTLIRQCVKETGLTPIKFVGH